jgi:hypothetical protein
MRSSLLLSVVGTLALVAALGVQPSSVRLVAAPLVGVPAMLPDQGGPTTAQTVRRSRYVGVTLQQMPTAGGPSADQRPSIRLDLFDDVSVTAVFDRFDPDARGTTWVGHVEGQPLSTVTLVYQDDVMTGSVLTPDATYLIRPAPADLRAATPLAAGSLHVVEDIDQAGFRPEGPMVEVVPPEMAADGYGVEVMGDSADQIDVLVVYTPSALAYTGSVAAMQNQIGIAISQTNTAYANSGVIQRLRLVHAAQVPYAESGNASTDLSNLRSGTGGLSGVAALRDTYAADMVALVQYDSASPYCGIGYLMSSPSAFFASYAFSVTEVDCVTNHTFAHELGHNMGLRHDWYMDGATSPYSYAHGHVNTGAAGNRWRTIMSYNNLCSAQGYNCTRLLAWSNPTLTYNGFPTGIAGGTKTNCTAGSTSANTCDADERQVLNNTAAIVANFRQAVSDVPGAFAKTSPSSGAASQPGTVTLSWQAASAATSYEYCLDTTVNGACNATWTGTGSSQSAAVGGLAAGTTYEWQVRAVNASGSTTANGGAAWTFSVGPAAGANLVANGTFASGSTGWQTFATPSSAYIVANVTGGVMQFYRVPPPAGATNQAVLFQQSGMPMASGAPVRLQFSLGNSDPVRKRVSVLVHDADFSDLAVCTFWLPANTSLATYTMRTHATRAWANATVSFYASSAGSSGGYYRIDNVTLQYEPTQAATRTDCVDPFTPSAAAQADGSDLLVNGGFTNGIGLAPWSLFGQIGPQIVNGVFEFVRPEGSPAGVVLQPTGQSLATGTIVTSTFQLGNSSGVRKRVSVLLHDSDFSDLTACTFWLAPGQPLSNYTMRGFTTKAWSNATISIYPSTVGLESWIRLDNVTLRPTPAAAIVGTECLEPGSAGDARADTSASPGGPLDLAVTPDAERADRDAGAEPAAAAIHTGEGVHLELSGVGEARLTFLSWLTPVGSIGLVEVSPDGEVWNTIHMVDSSDTWMPVDVDLRPWIGGPLRVRLVTIVSSVGDGPPGVWQVDDVATITDGVTIDRR